MNQVCSRNQRPRYHLALRKQLASLSISAVPNDPKTTCSRKCSTKRRADNSKVVSFAAWDAGLEQVYAIPHYSSFTLQEIHALWGSPHEHQAAEADLEEACVAAANGTDLRGLEYIMGHSDDSDDDYVQRIERGHQAVMHVQEWMKQSTKEEQYDDDLATIYQACAQESLAIALERGRQDALDALD